MTKFWFGMVALLTSLCFIGLAVFDVDTARDAVLVYVAVVSTFLALAHMEGKP